MISVEFYEFYENGWIWSDFGHLKKRLFAIEIEPLHQSPQNFRFTKQNKLLTDSERVLPSIILILRLRFDKISVHVPSEVLSTT